MQFTQVKAAEGLQGYTRSSWLIDFVLDFYQAQKGSIQDMELGPGNTGKIYVHCLSLQGLG